MLLRLDVFRHGLSQRLLLFRLAVVGEREVEVERQRTRQAREPPEGRFGFVKLILGYVFLLAWIRTPASEPQIC